MTHLTNLLRAFGTAAVLASLGACSATAPTASATPKLTDLLAQASQADQSGKKEQAVTLWKQAAAAHPRDKTAWANIANTRFEAAMYADAIAAAQEVLLRDPNDKVAHNTIATGGIRLATKAVGDLSRLNGFTGSLRVESQQLADTLRTSLGMSDTKELFTHADRTKEAKAQRPKSLSTVKAQLPRKGDAKFDGKPTAKNDANGGDEILGIFAK